MTLKEWYIIAEKALANAGFQNAQQEAKWLLAAALGQENSFITLNLTTLTSPNEDNKIQDWLNRRLQGEPLSRIKGVREFWSLPFHLNAHTLDPRPETEVLVEGVLRWIGPRTANPWRLLDLGTGTGCLLISLLHELKSAIGVGVDLHKETLSMARTNAILNGVEERSTFLSSNWTENLKGSFDIIVSNPPYIPLTEHEKLEKAVRDYDPPQALFAGKDGLACYRILSQAIKPFLTPKGFAIFEIGAGQKNDVEVIFQQSGYNILSTFKDLAGIERAIGMNR
ncbi:MAG: peptide chain release factor N(5)-glutamine methyltransferase [Alphaproteobacteria bacterium]|nr:peptide chain release factor N(5)-glutamine methyltransferase [Alphaproteobacteria bacterium]MBP9777069.1 peptide chain release factor N(5)-glutamine methyltransferase [Alphaproteobacteria bacterium]